MRCRAKPLICFWLSYVLFVSMAVMGRKQCLQLLSNWPLKSCLEWTGSMGEGWGWKVRRVSLHYAWICGIFCYQLLLQLFRLTCDQKTHCVPGKGTQTGIMHFGWSVSRTIWDLISVGVQSFTPSCLGVLPSVLSTPVPTLPNPPDHLSSLQS